MRIWVSGKGGVELKTLSFEVPEDVHMRVKIYALKRGMTVKKYLLSLIQKDMDDAQKNE